MTKVIVNGSFDILHMGHLKLLEHAKSYPDSYVLVLTDTDQRIKKLKGSSRPINTEYDRVNFLSALRFVDRVETFNSDEELADLIKEFSPDVMVKGGDYRNQHIIGAEYCKDIYFYDRYNDYSTTKFIQNIIDRR